MTSPTKVKELVQQLAQKHKFDLTRPGSALWVVGQVKSERTSLIIAVRQKSNQNLFVVGRTFISQDKEVMGFRVYYSEDWQPLAAVTDSEDLIRNPEPADKMLEGIIQRTFIHSNQAWIKIDEYNY